MIQKQKTKPRSDLSHISSLEDLQAEVRKVQVSIKEKELDLEARWKKLPSETMKATVGKIVPFALDNVVASKTWGLVRNAGTLLLSGGAKKDLKGTLLSSAKQIGLFTALKGLFSLWKKK